MKKTISLVLAILMVITMLPLNIVNAEGENEVSVVMWDSVNKKEVPTIGELNFTIQKGNPLEEVTRFKSNNGKAVLPLLADDYYNLVLEENDYYVSDHIFLVVENGTFLFDDEEKITVYLKPGATLPEPEDKEEFGEKAIIVFTNNGKTLLGDYTFVISDGKDEQSVKLDSNGSIEFRVYEDKNYTIKLIENSNYEMEEVTVRCEKATNDFGIQVYKLIKSDGSELNSLIVNSKETTEPQKETREFTFDVLCGSCGRIPVEVPITFKVTNVSNSDSKEYVSNSGQVKMSLTESEEYRVEVITNKEYDHDPVNLTVKKANGNLSVFTPDNALFTEFVMTKKDLTGECAEDVCDFSDKKITMAPIPIKVNNNGLLGDLPENDEVIFDLYNTSRSERVGEVRTVDGKIPALEVYEKDDYILFTSEKNKKYIMADVPFKKEVSELYFQANGENNLPIRHKTKNPYAKEAKLDVKYLQVRPIKEGDRLGSKYTIDYVRIAQDKDNPKDYSKLKFIFTSEYETIEATTLEADEWGVPLTALELIENAQYSVRVEDPDNKYAIENFPFTLVDKSERGPEHPQGWGDEKYVFNHAFCGNATFLTLVEKGTENNNNTVIKCSNGHTTVSGMNFHDLMLRTIRPDKNTVTSMEGKDFDLFRFKLINPKRCEVTKMAEGNFEIHREIPEGKEAANVYQVNKDGSLTKLEFKQNGNIVDIKTTTLSIYDTIIEYKTEEPDKEKEYIDIPDPLFLKVINKNLDPNRPDDQKVTKEEMESLTTISHWLDENGKPGIQDNAKEAILRDSKKNFRGTEDFKFGISYGIKSIEGIKYAKNLKELKLNENEISDISELADLKNLEYLEISRNRIKDLTPLKDLTKLWYLKLYNNLIEDISPIANLTNLKYLDVHYNVRVTGDENNKTFHEGITDISPLENLVNLEYLDICSNRISKGYEVLENLKKLTTIEASDNKIESIDFIKDLPELHDFSAARNRVADYDGLSDIIVPKVIKQLQEESGRMDFAGQFNILDEKVKAKENKVKFQGPYKGLKEIIEPIAKAFGMEEVEADVESSIDEIQASYDLDSGIFSLDIDPEYFDENKGKEVDLTLNISFLYTFNWRLSLKLIINEKSEQPEQPEQPEEPDQPEQPGTPEEPTPAPYNPGYRYEPSPDYLRDYTRRDEKPVERKKDKKEEKPVEGKKDEVPSTETLSPIDVMAPSLPVDLPDVNGNPAIIDMVARGIFKGMGSGKFEPGTTISRAMVTEVFMRISRDKSINQNIEFTDVKADDWFSNSVKWAADKNIVTGFEDGSFKANQKVTIQEFAAMLYRLITKYNINLSVVNPVNRNDFEYINEWSRESVIKMVEYGLINLDENGKIDPNREFKRVEIAEALYKLIKFIEEN